MPMLKQHWCIWDGKPTAVGRQHAMPHIKTYLRHRHATCYASCPGLAMCMWLLYSSGNWAHPPEMSLCVAGESLALQPSPYPSHTYSCGAQKAGGIMQGSKGGISGCDLPQPVQGGLGCPAEGRDPDVHHALRAGSHAAAQPGAGVPTHPVQHLSKITARWSCLQPCQSCGKIHQLQTEDQLYIQLDCSWLSHNCVG